MNHFHHFQHITSLKVYFLQAIALIVSFSQVESLLRVVLLVVSIMYTVWKLVDKYKDEDKNDQDEN